MIGNGKITVKRTPRATVICASFLYVTDPGYLLALRQIATAWKIVIGKITMYTKPGVRSIKDKIPSGMPMTALVRTPNTQYVRTKRTSPRQSRRRNPMISAPAARAERSVAAFRAAEIAVANAVVPRATAAFFRGLTNLGDLLFGRARPNGFGGGSACRKKQTQQYRERYFVHLFPLLAFDSVGYIVPFRCLKSPLTAVSAPDRFAAFLRP